MCHKGMARGSTAAVTLPVVTAIAGKVRPVAILMEIRPFTSDPLLSPRGSDGQESTSSDQRDVYPTTTHNQRFTTLILYHSARAV